MAYKDLQNKAKELGLPYVGIPREDLEQSIKMKEASSEVVAENGTSEKPSKTTTIEPQATAPAEVSLIEYNTAIIRSDGREIRRYSIDMHGENFETLARQFASKFKYDLEMKKVEPGVKCPSCGHVFNPE